jgi:hypothetical protein
MPSGRQVAAAIGVVVPVLVASGLAVGGYHSTGVAVTLFVIAGIWLAASAAYVPLRSRYYRRVGFAPIRATHKVTGKRAILRLDLGTTPGITRVACQVHLPQWLETGHQRGNVIADPGRGPERITTFIFPEDFGTVPLYRQMQVVGWYQVSWQVDQHGAPRTIAQDRFRIGPRRLARDRSPGSVPSP